MRGSRPRTQLGIIGNLGGNSLKALVRLTIGANNRIEAFFTCVKLFADPKLLSHLEAFLVGGLDQRYMVQRTMNINGNCCFAKTI